MAKLFKVTPNKSRNVNGVVEVKESFMRLYGVDLKKGCYTKGDFNVEILK